MAISSAGCRRSYTPSGSVTAASRRPTASAFRTRPGSMANGIATPAPRDRGGARAGMLGVLRSSGPFARRGRGRARRDRACARGARCPVGRQPHPLADRAGPRSKGHRSLPAPRRHARGSVGIHGADAEHRAVRRQRASTSRTAGSRAAGRARQGLAARGCAAVHEPRAGRPPGRAPRIAGSSPRPRPIWRRAFRSPATSPSRRTRAATPTTARSGRAPVILDLRDELEASLGRPGRSASAPPGAGRACRGRCCVRPRRRLRDGPARSIRPPSSPGCRPTPGACSPRPDLADVAMAAAADMFELGVKLQVLAGAGPCSPRAPTGLHDLYRRARLARRAAARGDPRAGAQDLSAPRWTPCGARPWRTGNSATPRSADRAHSDAKQRMALVFRWYLGKSSRWGHHRRNRPAR